MKTVCNLFYLNTKSKLKNIFRKPLAAILTVLGILMFFGFIAMALFMPNDIVGSPQPHLLGILTAGMSLFFLLSQLLNTKGKKALLMKEDSYYLFTMPLTTKQVLTFVVLNNIMTALMSGAYVTFMMVSLGMMLFPMTPIVLTMIFLSSTLVALLLAAFMDYTYLVSIEKPSFRKAELYIFIVLLLIIVALFIPHAIQNNFDLVASALSFVASPALNFVPVVGWEKAIVTGAAMGETWMVIIFLVVLLVATVALNVLLVNFKGAFYEEALEDSEEITEAYRSAQKGVIQINKVYETKGSFALNEWAFFSKGILLLKKTRQFIKKQDFVICVMYGLIAYLSDMGFAQFTMLMLIWIFISVMQTSIKDELKSPYLYLIPGNPYKKMLAIVIPTLVAPTAVIFFYNIVGGLVFQASFGEILESLARALSFLPVIIAGNILALRVLKSGTNVVAENLLRALITFAALIPTIAIAIFAAMFVSEMQQLVGIVQVAMIVVNFLIAFGVIMVCAPMLNGRELED